MTIKDNIDYQRIEKAISYLNTNFKSQPSLNEIASYINLSPYHFQRMFTKWAGVSPKKFLQYLNITYAKKLLKEKNISITEATYETGLSGTGRLHDLFINIEGMTPGEYKNGGTQLHINYSIANTHFGKVIIASTGKGICHLSFMTHKELALQELKSEFPNARFIQNLDPIQKNALFLFTKDWSQLNQIKLHLKGTPFQLKVWETLLKIPKGSLSTYGQIAGIINNPNASRAVGSAIAVNPVAYLIPCHRVIKVSGEFGEYHWGANRKSALIGWEAAQTNS
ncbi:methylated-DNA--[protein]-cysteine S-methyltransferase [Aquimarina brevivitae]|uniref:methylated-DNA--[protein]-cysteine S-methyltransferase n=1 Tax=Aquimarina brevivitae TaxID=323412 RepID=A0A4V2F5N0_9FLAO|nr:methylated-DNA--[protein]-cysteine S-methyltransferase [Aquimarina brevivitae]RZS93389.1 AraC family transcriptional regulator of adaptative response/methylated-DNA-[protein]-cysteine methyltransferase [Aquimarina brevivitae]